MQNYQQEIDNENRQNDSGPQRGDDRTPEVVSEGAQTGPSPVPYRIARRPRTMRGNQVVIYRHVDTRMNQPNSIPSCGFFGFKVTNVGVTGYGPDRRLRNTNKSQSENLCLGCDSKVTISTPQCNERIVAVFPANRIDEVIQIVNRLNQVLHTYSQDRKENTTLVEVNLGRIGSGNVLWYDDGTERRIGWNETHSRLELGPLFNSVTGHFDVRNDPPEILLAECWGLE
jgi:hypothetical protein